MANLAQEWVALVNAADVARAAWTRNTGNAATFTAYMAAVEALDAHVLATLGR